MWMQSLIKIKASGNLKWITTLLYCRYIITKCEKVSFTKAWSTERKRAMSEAFALKGSYHDEPNLTSTFEKKKSNFQNSKLLLKCKQIIYWSNKLLKKDCSEILQPDTHCCKAASYMTNHRFGIQKLDPSSHYKVVERGKKNLFKTVLVREKKDTTNIMLIQDNVFKIMLI